MMWWWSVALAGPPAPKLKAKTETWELSAAEVCWPSGLQLHVVRRPGTGVVALTMVIEGGDSGETEETLGAAHLVEHLWFRARPGGGPSLYEQEAGLSLDGRTERDATIYTTVGPASRLDDLLRIEAARLTDPLEGLGDAELESERAIVASELAWRGEHTDRLALAALDGLLFPEGHPYRNRHRDGAGLDRLGWEELRAWVAANHVPANVTLRIEGDVDTSFEHWTERLPKVFPDELLYGSGASSCAHPVSKDRPPDPPKDAFATLDAPVRHPTVWLGFSLPAASGEDESRMRQALALVEARIGASFAWESAGENDPLAGSGCSWSPGRRASLATCVVVVPSGQDPLAYVDRIRRDLHGVWETGPAADLARARLVRQARADALADTLAQQDDLSLGSLADRATYSHRSGSADSLGPRWNAIFGSDHRAVTEVAERWFRPERMAAVVLRPGTPATPRLAPFDGTVRLEAPALPKWAADPAPLDHLQTRTLTNGLEVWLARTRDVPILYGSLVFSGGPGRSDPSEALLIDRLARYDLTVGLEEFEYEIGVDTYEWMGALGFTDLVTGGSQTLEGQLWVLRALQDGRLLDFETRHSLLDRMVQLESPAFSTVPWSTASSFRLGHLAPDHPAGRPWWEVVRAARSVPEGRVQNLARATFDPATANLLLVGPVDPGLFAARAKVVEKWETKPGALPEVPPLPPVPARKVFVHPYDSLQTDVHLTCRLPGRGPSTDAGLDVLAAALELGTWQTLREGAGAYAPAVSIRDGADDLSWLDLQVVVDPEQAPGTVRAMLGLLERLHQDAPAPVVAWSRQVAAGRRARSWASAAGTWSVLADGAHHGLSLKDVQGYPGRLAAVDTAALAKLLEGCAGHEAVTVIGPDVTESLTDVGDVQRVDWKTFGAALAEDLR